MAFDRFITWDKQRPTREQLGFILEDFLGAAATEVKWDEPARRFFVVLPGSTTSPFRRVGGRDEFPTGDPRWETTARYIEVYHADGETTSVITRMADEYTNVVATGLATALARFYAAKLEMG